jgi:hypothetical protein
MIFVIFFVRPAIIPYIFKIAPKMGFLVAMVEKLKITYAHDGKDDARNYPS